MKSRNNSLEQLTQDSKGFHMLIKAFSLQLEKQGTYPPKKRIKKSA